jgi:hypothetical protein
MIEILNRWTRAQMFKSDTAQTILEAVLEAKKAGADLRGADLYGANLYGANLYGANLYGADLGGANLGGAKGLLPNGVKPLQIFGTMHALIVRTPGIIQIGCMEHDYAWWKEHYQAVGRSEGYSAEEVEEYAEHIEHALRWMNRHNVAEPAKEAVAEHASTTEVAAK